MTQSTSSMNRRTVLKGMAAGAAGLAMASLGLGQDAPATPPNIIFILADDMTPAYLSCYGGRTPTPNLDRLAKEGALFKACYCVSALCNPTRWTILTGQFAGRNPLTRSEAQPGEAYSVLQNTRLVPESPSIAPMLHEAGYYTGFVGKWHSNFEIKALTGENLPPAPGNAELDTPQADATLQKRQEIFAKAIKAAARFDWVSHVQWGNLGLRGAAGPLNIHNPEWLTDGALKFIDAAVKEKRPFFLHLANSVPHAPNNGLVLDADPRYTLGGRLSAPVAAHPPRASIAQRLTRAGLPVSSHQIGTVLLDDQVGAILARLKELGLDDNTIVMFAQDNGSLGKGSCYRGGVHSALVVRWPRGIKPGTVVEQDVSFVDFVPTMLDAAGAKPPAGYKSDGISFLPAARDGRKLPRAAVYQEAGNARSVVKGKYHYIAMRYTPSQIEAMKAPDANAALDTWGRPGGGDNHWLMPYKPAFFDPDQLYDMENDPLERTNLAADPAFAAVLADLKAELAGYLKTLDPPFPAEASDFLKTPRFAELVAARRKASEAGDYWPGYPKEDWERNENLNIKSPEEVDPTHRSCWKARKPSAGTQATE